MHADYRGALLDLQEGIRNREMWLRLGWSDVKAKYRRTFLGPLWNTASLGVAIFAMSVVMARLFNNDLSKFLPYLTSGMVTWTMMAAMFNEGGQVFIASESLIRSLRFPLTTLVCALVWRNFILFGHNLVIYLLVMLTTHVAMTSATLLAVPALLLVAVNAMWLAIILGILGARFRDIPPVVSALLQIVVFVTPIFWNPDQIKGKLGFVLIDLNVFYHFVEIVRRPLLGVAPSNVSWLVVLGVTLLGWAFTILLFSRFRRRIAFWL
jgi:ABC-type polysaccharide/polyol phosphate export permease